MEADTNPRGNSLPSCLGKPYPNGCVSSPSRLASVPLHPLAKQLAADPGKCRGRRREACDKVGWYRDRSSCLSSLAMCVICLGDEGFLLYFEKGSRL